ncbi:uncharacterized protein LOC107685261 [Sinocyclocheilus anshuiensis]|uniref:uncharacterized protein LOC107685261 n=1 Tax=Sinocyclocheilus anshuiensis TaxID=1608454 RepID=UPI0007B94573|nr:PREDICTED: uncharacterized protein LOC107685261 [Sinocyclocheilus anshuiensis]
MEQPPRMVSAFNHLEKELIKLLDSDYPQLQQCIENLRCIIGTFLDNNRSADKGSRDGAIAEAAGRTAMAVGLAFAPFTLGISALIISGAGAAVATGGMIGSVVWNKKKTNQEAQLRKEVEAELRAFQNKIIPMAEKIKDISQRIKEILRDLSNPEHNVSYLSKYFTSACELVHFLQIYDVGGLAVQISKTVHLTGDITDILARVSTDILQKLTDVQRQISLLECMMGEIKKTTDKMANH